MNEYKINKEDVGYYDNPAQTEPKHNPSPFVGCPICEEKIDSEDNMRTISLGALSYGRSYFYRTHRTCHEDLGNQARLDLDQSVFNAVEPVPLAKLN